MLKLSLPPVTPPVTEPTKRPKDSHVNGLYLLLDSMYAKVLSESMITVDEDIVRIYFTEMGKKDLVTNIDDRALRHLGRLYKGAIEKFIVSCYCTKIERAIHRTVDALAKDRRIVIPRTTMRIVQELASDALSVKELPRRRFAIEEIMTETSMNLIGKNLWNMVPLESTELSDKFASALVRGVNQELAEVTKVGTKAALFNASRYIMLGYYLQLTRSECLGDLNWSAAHGVGYGAISNDTRPETLVDHQVRSINNEAQYQGIQPWHVMCMDHTKTYPTQHADKLIHPDVARIVRVLQAIATQDSYRGERDVPCSPSCGGR